uniref:Uncharacterized protein n=1 Tax=Panagrolaimus sp. ES5 TaxID=591445 RepID=A0AC34GAB2_9BILA
IDSNERQLDSSIEYEKARKTSQDNDFSNFATLFDKPGQPVTEIFSKPDKPKPEPFTNSTKKEVDTINSELPEATNPKYCNDYSENFAFYCDQAISLVAKTIRPFCVSYIANCPKQSQALARQ